MSWQISEAFEPLIGGMCGLTYRGMRRGAPFWLDFVYSPVLAWLGVASNELALQAELKHIYPRSRQCSWLALKIQVALERAHLEAVTFSIDDLVLPAERPRLARQRGAMRDLTWHPLGFLLSTRVHIDFDAPWPPFNGWLFTLVDPAIEIEGTAGYFDAMFGPPYDRSQPPSSVTIALSQAALAHRERCERIAEARSS